MVSIIIVNYNGLKHLPRCISALRRQTYREFEIIVADNGSRDDSLLWLSSCPDLKVVPLAENRGFTGGNIAGYAAAAGDLIALLNNDTEVSERWLEELVSAMESDPRIGTCSSRIIVTESGLVDSVGGRFTTAGSGFKWGEGEPPENYPDPCQVEGACAAAVLYRRAMLEEVGFLDDDLFLNYEDTDLDFRALLAGWKSVYVPTAVVLHDVSATLGRMSDTTVYYFSRNSLLVWLKNMPLPLMLRFFHHRLLYELFALAYFCIVGGRWKAYFAGKLAILPLLPRMLRKRRAIQRSRRLSSKELRGVMLPIPSYLSRRCSSLAARKGGGSVTGS